MVEMMQPNLLGKRIILPVCILQCQSLVELKLIGDFSITCPDEEFVVTLPKLKKLHLSGGFVELWSVIFRSCPLLEDLNVNIECSEKSKHFTDLSAHNLKRLVIIDDVYDYLTQLQAKFVINVSNLEEITIHASSMALFRFVGDSSALDKADIRLVFPLEYQRSSVAELTKLISSVKSVGLNVIAYQVVIGCTGLNEVHQLAVFLRCCPCLKVLQLVLHWCRGIRPNSEMIRLLLQYKTEIKLLSFCVDQAYDVQSDEAIVMPEEYDFCEKLFGIPNPSVCEIKFSGRYVHATNKNFIPSSLK